MPTYEYACRDCGEHLEVVQSFKDAPLTECGRCGGTLRKVFSAAGIIFKGSGYYVTDSRTKPARGDSAGDKTSSEGSDKKPASEGSDKKPGSSGGGEKKTTPSGDSAGTSSTESAKSA